MLNVKKIFIVLAIFFIAIGLCINVNAADEEVNWTDFNNSKIEIKKEGNLNYISFSGVDLKSDSSSYTSINLDTYRQGSSDKRKINIKVGTINDKTILKNIKDNKSGALESLLEYAKKQTDYNYTNTVDVNYS